MHLTHFYNVAKGSRKEKSIEAINSIGVSILGGAATTMGAGIPLFFCAMTFFKLCGWFIFFTSLVSLATSFFLLMPMLMCFGPEGEQGDLKAICRNLKGEGKATATKGFESTPSEGQKA